MSATSVAENQTIADAMRALRDQDSPAITSHPNVEQLYAYQTSRLPSAEAEEIEEHFVHCRDCTVRSVELAHFLASAEERSPGETRTAEKPGRREQGFRWFRQPQSLQSLAAGLLIAMLITSGGWLLTQQEANRLEGELGRRGNGEINVPVVFIDEAARRGTEPRREAEPVAVPAGAVLVLTPLKEPKDVAHEVRIFTPAGGRVWSQRGLRPAQGNFHLRLPRSLAAGEIYHIQIAPGEDQEFNIRITSPRSN